MACSCQLQKFTAFLKASIRDAVDCENGGASYSDLSPVYAIYFSGRCVVLNDMCHARSGEGGCVSYMKGCTQELFLEAVDSLNGKCIDGLMYTMENASIHALKDLHQYLEDAYLDYREPDTLDEAIVKRFDITVPEDITREQIQTLMKRVEIWDDRFPCEMKMLPVNETDCKSCLTIRRDTLRQDLTKSKETLNRLQQQILDVEERIVKDTAEISKLDALL